MFKFIFKNCKSYTWVSILVLFLGVLSSVAGQYIYKMAGYIIDYGLNFTGETHTGEFAFLFDGTFGDYGTVKLVISLGIVLVLSGLLSYLCGYLSSYVQMIFQYRIANGLRRKLYFKVQREKIDIANGDYLNILFDDIYNPGNLWITYYTGVITNFGTIVFCLLMLNSISPYLLITPIAMSPLLIYLALKYNKASYKKNAEFREVDGDLKSSIDKTTCTNSMDEFNNFTIVNQKHTSERKMLSLVGNKYGSLMNFVKILIYIVSCTVAGVLAINGQILIGEYLIFTSFINTIYSQIIAVINNLITIKSSQPKVEKVKNILEKDYASVSK